MNMVKKEENKRDGKFIGPLKSLLYEGICFSCVNISQTELKTT